MTRGSRAFLLLLTCFGALSLGASADAQAPASPPAAPPPIYAPPSIYALPVYTPSPFPVKAPYDDEPDARQWGRDRRPFRKLAWRALLEGGGSLGGRVLTSVDGQLIRKQDAVDSARELVGVFDLRLGMQRLFGEWFGLGLQLGYANWQSGYFDELNHRRSHALSLALVPELRIKLGRSCRRCISLIAGLRVGGVLSVSGAYRNQGFHQAQAELGGGGLWGVQGGLEARVAQRLSLRAMAHYEGAFLQNRVDYGRLGSELLSFRIDRGVITFAFAVGLL